MFDLPRLWDNVLLRSNNYLWMWTGPSGPISQEASHQVQLLQKHLGSSSLGKYSYSQYYLCSPLSYSFFYCSPENKTGRTWWVGKPASYFIQLAASARRDIASSVTPRLELRGWKYFSFHACQKTGCMHERSARQTHCTIGNQWSCWQNFSLLSVISPL